MIGPKPREDLASIPDEVDGGRVVYGRFVRLDDFGVIAARKAMTPSSLIMANKVRHAGSYVPPRNLSVLWSKLTKFEHQITNVYRNGNKVFNLVRGHRLVAMTCGMGNFDRAPIATLTKDLRKLFSSSPPARGRPP